MTRTAYAWMIKVGFANPEGASEFWLLDSGF